MSHPSRPQARGPAQRRRRQWLIEPIQQLEERQVLTPIVTINAPLVTFTAAATPTNPILGTVTVTPNAGTALTTSAAAYTSVAQLTPISSFGNDIVHIQAGPGGDFGSGVYAISRGAGENANAINRPGVIYRVDPATGKASVFFDLNTVISQLEPGGNASNSAGAATGLVNWYSIAFDPEGYFDGRPSMFVTSIDRLDPNKNAIFRIGPDGSFMGMFVQFSNTGTASGFTRGPSSILVPPPEQQTFLRGMLVGDGFSASTEGFAALFFNANQFRPGTNLSGAALPPGVTATNLTFGPQVGITSASLEYPDSVYSAFTDFGTPGAGGIPAAPGLSGIQGLGGELLINNGTPIVTTYTQAGAATPDTAAAIITPFRRFEDIAYDQYGYFSYGTTVTVNAATGVTTVGSQTPTYVGNLFASDLGTGLSTPVTPVAPLPTTPPVNVPIQGSGTIGVTTDGSGNVVPIFTNGNTTGGSNIGGRIVRISPSGVVTTFASGFHTSGDQVSSAFAKSDLSITFSADGTILYAADDDGIWQFKTVTDLASSTTGSLVGLNDLRSLGVPYNGQDSAVAVVDTGVDALSPPLRSRVSNGFNTYNNGFGNDDLAASTGTTATSAGANGHGTPVAGVITQFVPQTTIDPINIFAPNLATSAGGTATTLASATTGNELYNGMKYLTQNPFVNDPVRPNTQARVIAANFGFGTTTTYDTEGSAFRSAKQLIISLKNQLKRFRSLGIAPIAAAGQFGGTTSTATAATGTLGNANGISLPAVLNEVISVTGSYPFPFTGTATSSPIDPGTGVVPRPVGPVLLFGNGTTITGLQNQAIVTPDVVIFKDKILATSNRSVTTDFSAPEIDVPTFGRTFTGDGHVHNVFNLAGTSYSSAVVTGSYALTSSAIDYWTNLAKSGTTVDAYLTQPVGVNTLNYGPHQLIDLTAYSNPDAINAILQWTAVPITDTPNAADAISLPTLFGGVNYREYSRVDVGNAVAAIEGTVALNYLIAHNDLTLIDTNKDNLITAQELQTFTDNATTMGVPEAGAMARLLGGTATIPTTGFQSTAVGELPDQPDVLQRRFNFFDYAADGQLNGVLSIPQLTVLAKNLLPAPDAFVVNDRQRSSINGYLLDPTPRRSYSDLQHIKPTYAFVPASVVKRFRNISPAQFGVGKKLIPGTYGPLFTLFGSGAGSNSKSKSSTTTSTGTGTTTSNTPTTGTTTTGTTGTTTTGTTTGQTPAVAPGNTGNTGTTGTTGTNQPTGSSSSYQQSVLDALNKIAQGATSTNGSSTNTSSSSSSSTSTSSKTPNVAAETIAPPIAATTSTPTASSSTPKIAAETLAPTPTPTNTTQTQTNGGSTATTRPRVNLLTVGHTSRVETPAATHTTSHTQPKKSTGFFGHLYNNISKLWGHKN